MFVEKVPASVELEAVEFAAEPEVELPLDSASPEVLRGPAMPGSVETLPCAERRAWRTPDQEERLLRRHEVPRLLSHLGPGEVPGVPVLIFIRQVQGKARQQPQARQQLHGARDSWHAVDLSHEAFDRASPFSPVRVRVSSQPRDELEDLAVPLQHELTEAHILSHSSQHRPNVGIVGPDLKGQQVLH